MSAASSAGGSRPKAIERPPEGADGAPALFVDEPFPPYRFVPGVTPHPYAHADGWGYGQERPTPPFVPPERWHENETFLRGCDFFNRGWWWEAHETWEELWHVVEGRHARLWDLLKGLIQLAACALQRERGVDKGAERLLSSALKYLGQITADGQSSQPLETDQVSPRFCGLDLVALSVEAQERLGQPLSRVDGFYLCPSSGGVSRPTAD